MFAKIIPAIKLPKSLDFFDYKIPEKLKSRARIGQMVEIPFRHKNIPGILIELLEKSGVKKEIKEIGDIIADDPILTPQQISLAVWASEYYYVSLASVIKMMLPEMLKKKIKLKKFKLGIDQRAIVKNNDLAKYIKDIKQTDKVLFIFNHEKIKTAFYVKLIEKNLLAKKTCLIVVPEKIDIANLLQYFPQKWEDKISIINSELSKSRFNSEYYKIKNNSGKIVIGTRLSVFAPFKNLGLIIIDQEENPNHKQSEQNPRFSAKKAALELSKISKACLIYSSCAPSLESYHKAKSEELKLISACDNNQSQRIKIIDLKNEIKVKNYSPVSNYLFKKIEDCLSVNKKIFLFVNKKGLANSVTCRDCGYVFNCDICHKPYVIYKTGKEYTLLCHLCQKKIDFSPVCPKCKGVNLKESGWGIQRVEAEIKRLFPRHDTSSFDSNTIQIDQSIHSKIEILIGTHLLFKRLDWPKIGLVGVISADNLLHLPDFRAGERTFQILKKLSVNIGENTGAEMIIQTFHPNHPAITSQSRNNFDFFYNNEMEERKIFNYPPFCRLIKIIAQEKTNQKARDEAQKMHKRLIGLTEELKIENVEITAPLPSLFVKIKNQHRFLISLKLPNNCGNNTIKALLSIIPDNWIIDIDPETLL